MMMIDGKAKSGLKKTVVLPFAADPKILKSTGGFLFFYFFLPFFRRKKSNIQKREKKKKKLKKKKKISDRPTLVLAP